MKLKEVIKNIVEDNGCELYDIEQTEEGDNKFYRVYTVSYTHLTLPTKA